jgi:hypothetical protein
MTKSQVADLYEEITGYEYCYGMTKSEMVEEIEATLNN